MLDIKNIKTISDMKKLKKELSALVELLAIAIHLDLMGGYIDIEKRQFDLVDLSINKHLENIQNLFCH